MEKQLPQRKHIRLKEYDYSTPGAYFVTICTQGRRCVLSHIVGRGLAPAKIHGVEYTKYGDIAERQLLLLQERYSFLTIDRYVIMPNHIHAILTLMNETAGASPRPTLMDILCAYKSLTARECKQNGLAGRLFQSSFYEHVIRGQEDYDEILNYISENPLRWMDDELYSEN